MADPKQKSWIPAASIVGVTYALIGIVFAAPSAHVLLWRRAAWVGSVVVYFAHICYERFRLGNSHARAGLHVALGGALGAFGLAVSANIHALNVGSPAQHRLLLMLSLALWPLLVAAPAFCVALATSWVVTRIVGRRNATRASLR